MELDVCGSHEISQFLNQHDEFSLVSGLEFHHCTHTSTLTFQNNFNEFLKHEERDYHSHKAFLYLFFSFRSSDFLCSGTSGRSSGGGVWYGEPSQLGSALQPHAYGQRRGSFWLASLYHGFDGG